MRPALGQTSAATRGWPRGHRNHPSSARGRHACLGALLARRRAPREEDRTRHPEGCGGGAHRSPGGSRSRRAPPRQRRTFDAYARAWLAAQRRGSKPRPTRSTRRTYGCVWSTAHSGNSASVDITRGAGRSVRRRAARARQAQRQVDQQQPHPAAPDPGPRRARRHHRQQPGRRHEPGRLAEAPLRVSPHAAPRP